MIGTRVYVNMPHFAVEDGFILVETIVETDAEKGVSVTLEIMDELEGVLKTVTVAWSNEEMGNHLQEMDDNDSKWNSWEATL